jgi:hypothetical protein
MALVQYLQITGDGLGSAPRPPLRLGSQFRAVHTFQEAQGGEHALQKLRELSTSAWPEEPLPQPLAHSSAPHRQG